MSAKKILTVTLTWPGDLPLSREALAEKLAEVVYAPDVAMTDPVEAGLADYAVWEDGTEAHWTIEERS